MKKKNKVVKTIVISLVALLLFTSVYSVVEVYASDKDKKSNNSAPLPIETIRTYTVTFDSKGGSKVSSITVNENETINLPDKPTYNGYTFVNWTYEDGSEFKSDAPITSDITLYAVWKKVPVKTTTNTNTTSTTSEQKSEIKRVFTEKHAMVVGDSMAEGLSCYGVLNKENVVFTRGRRIDNMEKDLPLVKEYSPNYLFLSYGCNDVKMHNGNVEKFIKYYREKLEYLKSELPNTKIIVNLIIPVGDNAVSKYPAYQYLDEFNQKLIELLNELGVPYLDNSAYLKERENPYAGDGIHPKTFYFFRWGENMTEYLKNN